MPSRRVTRRRFLATSAAVAGSAPFVKAFAPGEPKEKLRLAVIGVADRGAANLAGVKDEEIVALCDVDESRGGKARSQFPQAQLFTDYRRMFDAVLNKIDAVVVSTPDHTHAHPSLIALGAGKHLYCEKPLARTVEEVRRMTRAAADAKAVTQMGTQIHAGDNYRRVVEIVQSGRLGEVKRVHVWLGSRPPAGKKTRPRTSAKFDLDQWLGPLPQEFFHAEHPDSPHNSPARPWPHFHWRYWWAFGGGQLADFGCHFMDLPFWALGLAAPVKVAAKGTPIPKADNDVPETMQVDYHFPNGVHLTWYHGVPGPALDGSVRVAGFGSGVLFEGTGGKLVADYSKYRILPDEFARDFQPPAPSIPKSVGHHKEWLDAVRTGGQPLCHFGYAGVLTEAVLLGNVAYRAGRQIAWDAAAGKTDSPEADRFVKWEVRKGWELG
jgi:predicted dehydrogenase